MSKHKPPRDSETDKTVADHPEPSQPAGDWDDPTRPGTRSRVIPAPAKPPDASPAFELGEPPDASDTPSQVSRRATRSFVPWLLTILALFALAYVIARLYMPALEEARHKDTRLAAALKDAAILQRQVETLESLHDELASKVAQREKEVQELQSTQEELAAKLESEIRKGNVAIREARGELVVDLIDKVLFDSGEAELNEKGAEVLRQVGETLLKVPGKVIQVTGHTDAVPISDKLVHRFPTNWELSTHRATNVVRFLEEKVKVPGKRLAAVGRSQYKPIASNASASGRRRNRRIEVTLLPSARGRR